MIDVDEKLALLDAGGDVAESLEAGAVGGDDEIELFATFGFRNETFAVEETEFGRNGILIPDSDAFAFSAQGESEAELGADAIAIGANVADDADGAARGDVFEDALDDLRARLHSVGSGV